MNIPPTPPTASLKEINDVLMISHDNVDEFIERFLSIKELSSDPVLHLVTLYSLYEYINKTKGGNLVKSFEKAKNLGVNISIV